MLLVCSYCRKKLREVPGGRVDDVSHGMCDACALYFERLWAGMHLGEYLDGLPGAVVLLNREARVLAANEKASELLGRDPATPRGLLGGEALACAHSRLPEGCGKTIHCRECAIRNTVVKVAQTGTSVKGVRAFLATDDGRIPLEISARPIEGLVEVTVDEVGPLPEPPEKPGKP